MTISELYGWAKGLDITEDVLLIKTNNGVIHLTPDMLSPSYVDDNTVINCEKK